MKNIVIAAGYATRLYPLTENFPKPLLKVGDRSILERMLDDIDPLPEIDSHIIVTNHKFAPIFEEWLKNMSYTKPVTIIDDGTESNETRLGAVRDLLLAIEQCNVDDDIMVLAADNILEFSLSGFIEFFRDKGTSVIMCHHEPELRRLQRTGVIAVDDDMKVLEMQEKPEKPVSNWAVPPFYIYSRKDMPLIRECLSHGCGYDAPGNLAHYLAEVSILHAWPMPAGRFDIGSLDSYKEAQERFS
ncbi:MAG: nucleotidyltransferase family protein [Duncaniella sp.]|uniref:nucleotidyltransferase family protein n=1 Tax=Duncaniella sp. TaxID=2518496 RepID=UPI0023BE3CD4|nr:nucleotidyltransferase family protein [Duncaniella sp.]MDE6089304.1 nucleotidyltransferase family protein [Duncaniella sp.]